MKPLLLVGVAMVKLQLLVLELVPKAIGHLHRRMRRIVRQVGEEGLFRLHTLLDEGHGLVGEVVDAKALSLDQFAVPLEWRAEVVAPVAGAKAVVLLETAAVRVIRVLHAVVPLAEGAGAVARRLEEIGDGGFVEIEPFAARRRTVDAAAWMIASGEEFGPSWRANGANVKAIEGSPVSS